MRSSLECIPCFISQGLSVARLATDDPRDQEQILREVLFRASRADLSLMPARFSNEMHQMIRRFAGKDDPYLGIKRRSNQLAMELLPGWRARLKNLDGPREAALKAVIAANVIDFGVKGDLTAEQIPAALKSSFCGPLIGDVDGFFKAAERATSILFLADNAGEIVFDRLLIEMLPRGKITVVVKGGPAINDALMEDAETAGLKNLADVIETGTDGAGIVLENCSPEFQRCFARADMVIAKGQANFESLDGCNRPVYFLFKVKCAVVARHIGRPVGSLMLHHYVPAV